MCPTAHLAGIAHPGHTALVLSPPDERQHPAESPACRKPVSGCPTSRSTSRTGRATPCTRCSAAPACACHVQPCGRPGRLGRSAAVPRPRRARHRAAAAPPRHRSSGPTATSPRSGRPTTPPASMTTCSTWRPPGSPPPTPSNWSTRRIVSRSAAVRQVNRAREWCSNSASRGPMGVPVSVSSRISATVNPKPRQPTRSAAHLRAIDNNRRPATASPRRTANSGAAAPDVPITGLPCRAAVLCAAVLALADHVPRPEADSHARAVPCRTPGPLRMATAQGHRRPRPRGANHTRREADDALRLPGAAVQRSR
jgi:hypothetical protein